MQACFISAFIVASSALLTVYDDRAQPPANEVATPKDPLFPGFFVNFYTDDAPKVGMLHGVYKTYAVASSRAAELRRGRHVVKAEIEWIDDEGKKHLRTIGRSSEALTRIAKELTGPDHRASYERLPSGQTQCSTFVRDFAKELLGRDIPELAGTANEQYSHLKNSASVEKLWVPSGHEAELASAQEALAAARQLEHDRKAAVTGGHAERAGELEQQRDIERYTARLKIDALQDAFQSAQLRANNQGDLVLVAWKSGPADNGHIAVVVPSPANGPSLSPSGDWGLMKMPYIAQAGRDVFPSRGMSYGFHSVESVKNLAIFAIKAP